MKFRHPTIQQGRVAHPVHGVFLIHDGVLDCPPELGRELRAAPVIEPPPVASAPDTPSSPEATTVDAPTFEESAAYLEGLQSGLSHTEALEFAGLQRCSARPEPSADDLARLADMVRDEIAARAARAAGQESATPPKTTGRGGKNGKK